jgi:hypothetical protein
MFVRARGGHPFVYRPPVNFQLPLLIRSVTDGGAPAAALHELLSVLKVDKGRYAGAHLPARGSGERCELPVGSGTKPRPPTFFGDFYVQSVQEKS